MLKIIKVLKEILIIFSVWVLFMLVFYGVTNLDTMFFGILMLVFLIFYRFKKNKDVDYLKRIRKFFWGSLLFLAILGFIITPPTTKNVNKKEIPPKTKTKDNAINSSKQKEEKKSEENIGKENTKEVKKDKVKNKKQSNKNKTEFEKVNIDERILKISKLELSKTAKFESVMLMIQDVELTEKEVLNYTKYLLKEHEQDVYIKKLENEEYALKNIAISYLVSNSTSNRAVDAFAFDFHQNSKYIYRGVDTPTSHDTMENKYQLDKNRIEVEEYVGYKKKTPNESKSKSNLSEEDFMYLLLEIDSETSKLKRLFQEFNEQNPEVVNQDSWRKKILSHILKIEENISKIKNSNIYHERVLSSENAINSFKIMELNAKSSRLMYESIIENDSKKMDEAVHILLIEIPSLSE